MGGVSSGEGGGAFDFSGEGVPLVSLFFLVLATPTSFPPFLYSYMVSMCPFTLPKRAGCNGPAPGTSAEPDFSLSYIQLSSFVSKQGGLPQKRTLKAQGKRRARVDVARWLQVGRLFSGAFSFLRTDEDYGPDVKHFSLGT